MKLKSFLFGLVAALAVTGAQVADQVHAKAQSDPGGIYENDRGVPQDDAGAAKWYRRAAERGDAAAQTKLGRIYLLGLGVLKDDAEAVHWFLL